MNGIRRLARDLNISIGTVSRALNGKPDVSTLTRERVLQAAAERGYVPNHSGRSLRRGTTNAIGFMIELNSEQVASGDNFFMTLFDGLQQVLGRHNLDLLVLPCPSGEDPLPFLKRLVARGAVDGVVLSSTQRVDRRIDFLEQARVPFLTLGRSGTAGDYPWIDLDFEGVARLAIDRLVGFGHRRIAVALPKTEVNLGYVFHDGYRAALQRHGLAHDPDLVFRCALSEAGGYQLADALTGMPDPPTAVLLIQEILTTGLYRRLAEKGLTPGRDLAVVGLRDAPSNRALSPSVTCFRMDLHGLGVAVGEALLPRLPSFEGAGPPEKVEIIWPIELIAGDSDAMILSGGPRQAR